LTTIRYPAFGEGYQGVELLLAYIEGRATGQKIVQIPTRLVVRESCGCLIGVPMQRAAESEVVSASGARSREETIAAVTQDLTNAMGITCRTWPG
jgi:hypothetical protein